MKPYEFTYFRRVQFADTDMAGIVHWANFFRYAEEAEHAFFRSVGLSIQMQEENGAVGWPRVRTDFQFSQPLRFEDELRVQLVVQKIGRGSITYRHLFFRVDGEELIEVARGNVVAACVKMNSEDGTITPTPVPEQVKNRIQPAPRG